MQTDGIEKTKLLLAVICKTVKNSVYKYHCCGLYMLCTLTVFLVTNLHQLLFVFLALCMHACMCVLRL